MFKVLKAFTTGDLTSSKGKVIEIKDKKVSEMLIKAGIIKKTLENQGFFYGAESRNRTGTGAKSQQILSLLRLPVPPYPRGRKHFALYLII